MRDRPVMSHRMIGLVAAVGIALTGLRATGADDSPPEATEFFEKEVRPLLVSRCHSCHGAEKQKGGLRLDSREAALRGGDTGPAVVPGNSAESPLVEAINYGELVQMPPKSKLPPAEIAALTKWVEMGAPWPSASVAARSTPADVLDLRGRASHWSFQPVGAGTPPHVRDTSWPLTPIDAFLRAELEAKALEPAPDADRRTWLRRVTFDLIGLPPTPEEVDSFIHDASPIAHERQVDRLLASPHYGERWARHWLDLVRYAETAGHEFDYDIPEAWRYRDYVVRALSADLPYDRFVVEHLAGDLLPDPRGNPADGTNESILGTGFYRLGEGTHSPVDLREDEAARIDNQLDVLGKTFLGLTIACARCHDHKFDPISQNDYYALSGYLRSSRHQHAFLDPPERIRAKALELERIGAAMARRLGPNDPPATPCARVQPPDEGRRRSGVLFEGFDERTYAPWSVTGDAFGDRPTREGDLRIEAAGAMPTAHKITPGQAHSGRISDRLQGVLRSPTFTIQHKAVHYLAAGRAGRINLIIDGFEKVRDPIYGGLTLAVDAGDVPRWYTQDVAMWQGHRAYIEIADGATLNFTGARTQFFTGDGWIAVDEVRFDDGPPPSTLTTGTAAIPLDTSDAELQRLVADLVRVEASIPPPTLGPALADGSGEDAPLHIRGSTKTLGGPVPRRFLEVFGGDNPAPPAVGSGRLELAERLVDPSNPLVARVVVNRVWKHHFGEGLVRTPDDFGVMGQPPSHPELLDWLADRFVHDGWSLKRLHRMIVLSRAYRMRSTADPAADSADPGNRLLHRMNVRRLEAEALRDAVLAVAGRLDRRAFGPSVPPHLTPFQEGRGRPSSSGPLDGDGRRTLYLNVRRNFLPPLLMAFDFPAPATAVGRRNVSNVPAQALTMLNDPFLIEQASLWAGREQARGGGLNAIVTRLYEAAFSRPPTPHERAAAVAFLDKHPGPQALADLCHVLLNVKEFLFIP
jgi:hypothetical protein